MTNLNLCVAPLLTFYPGNRWCFLFYGKTNKKNLSSNCYTEKLTFSFQIAARSCFGGVVCRRR